MKTLSRISLHTAIFCLTGFLILVPAGAFCAADAGSEDLRLGDKAYASGDYASAERFYKKATVLLDSPLWEKCMMQLSRVYLKQGDTASASDVLARLKQRNPEYSVGILPGLILAAEGNYRSAVKIFRPLSLQNGPDRLEALYQLGAASLMTGDFKEAMEIFSKLEKAPVPAVAARGRHARIYALIYNKQYEQALELLARTEKSAENARLSLLLLAKSGKFADFKNSWNKVRAGFGDPRPERLIYEICRNGAQLAEKEKDIAFAAECLNDSFKFAPDNARRKDVMRRLFNVQSNKDIDGAVETVRRYCSVFPEAHDKALMMIQCGRLLAGNNRCKEAVEIFRQVMKDEENLLEERRSAAFEAAASAEKAEQFAVAEEMYHYLISRSTTPEVKQNSEFLLGEFYVRRKNHAEAEKYFNRVISQGGTKADDARHRLLAVLIDSGDYAKAKQTAAVLLESSNADYANYARYRLAGLTELEGDLENAHKLYLEYVAKAPASTLAPAAAFSAARLAERTGNMAAAAAEYLAFASKYPSDINTAAALFLALRAECLTGRTQIAWKCLEILSAKHAALPEFNAALLQFADYFFNIKDYKQALEVLKRRPLDNTHAASMFLLWEVRIRLALGETASALQIGREVLSKYPTSREAAEAHFLCGNILADLGENNMALSHFRQAEKSGQPGVFAEVVSGRIADCSVALFSGSDFDRRFLEGALQRYQKLAEEAKLPEVKLQSLCKAGQCSELLGDSRMALEYYEKTLYFASLLKNNNFSPDAVWCARAAYAGAKAAVKGKNPERLVRALRMIRLYEELSLPKTGEDFDTLRKELHNSYNLLKRKGK